MKTHGAEHKEKKESKDEREKILLLEKGKSGLLTFIFGRATLTIALILVQIAFFIMFSVWLESYTVYLFGVHMLISVVMALLVLNKPGNPVFQMSWAIFVLLLPIVGGMMYFVFEVKIGSRYISSRLSKIMTETKNLVLQDESVIRSLQEKSPCTAGLAEYVRRTGAFPVYKNNGIRYFPSGESKFVEMIKRMESARHFIFLEYFIIAEGYMWGRVLKILEEKVKEGVEVRLIYDGLCSVKLLPVRYPKELEKLGIKCKVFSKLRPFFSTSYNNRDHRKIVIVDGEVGFTGGINLADEYINRKMRFGHWKDTGIMIEGEPVKNMTLMFLQMWNIDEWSSDDYGKYIDLSRQSDMLYKGYVQPFADSPFDDEQVGKRIYLDTINRAEKSVCIMTPYLVLDYEMIQALTYAAKRGVEVKIIMPSIPDKKYVFAVSKTYYDELLAAGVRIFEYTPGFVHAKVITADDSTAVVGSVNFDYRSFYLHFECGVYMYGADITAIEEDIRETIERSEEITVENHRRHGFIMKTAGALLKLFAPLM